MTDSAWSLTFSLVAGPAFPCIQSAFNGLCRRDGPHSALALLTVTDSAGSGLVIERLAFLHQLIAVDRRHRVIGGQKEDVKKQEFCCWQASV